MEDRSQYLGLAQLSQSVVRSILLYLEEDQWEPLRGALPKIVESLDAYLSNQAAEGSAPFASYEQLSTLSEAWTDAETQSVVNRLKSFLAAGNGPEARQEAEALIAPFRKLSTQALLNFDQPELGVPRGIFELCRAR